MKYRVEFSNDAIEDFTDLYDYLAAQAGKDVATRYVTRLYAYCMGFETFPERGSRSEGRANLRSVGYRNRATIAFRVNDDVVTIVRLFYGGRAVIFPNDAE